MAGIVSRLLQQAELDRQGYELLLRPVVQVTFDLPPLGVLCFYQPTAGGSQLVDRRLQLGGELDVAQEEADLGGQVPQQLVLGGGQRLLRWLLQGKRASISSPCRTGTARDTAAKGEAHPPSIVGHQRTVERGHGHLGKRLHPPLG